jgi:hypothetical protein
MTKMIHRKRRQFLVSAGGTVMLGASARLWPHHHSRARRIKPPICRAMLIGNDRAR